MPKDSPKYGNLNMERESKHLLKQVIKSTRKIVETAISCVPCLFPKVTSVKTSKGLELKLLMFLLAKGCGDYISAVRVF